MDPEGDTLQFTLPTGAQGTCDPAFGLAGGSLVGSGAGMIVPTDTVPGMKTCEVVVSDGALSATVPLFIVAIENTKHDVHVRNALTGIARTMGWDAVDAIRTRVGVGGTGATVDLSSLTSRLRELAAAKSGAMEEVRFDGLLPSSSRMAGLANGGIGHATGSARL